MLHGGEERVEGVVRDLVPVEDERKALAQERQHIRRVPGVDGQHAVEAALPVVRRRVVVVDEAEHERVRRDFRLVVAHVLHPLGERPVALHPPAVRPGVRHERAAHVEAPRPGVAGVERLPEPFGLRPLVDHHERRVDLLAGRHGLDPEVDRHLVADVAAEAVASEAHPVQHRVDQVLAHALRLEVDEGEPPVGRLHRAVGIPLEGVGELVLQHVVRPAMEVDEIHVDLHAERMGAVIERLEVRVRAVFRVDPVVVGDAVGVLRRVVAAPDLAVRPSVAVHVAVGVDERRQVDDVDAKGAHVVEHLRRGLEVAAAREVAQHDLVDDGALQVVRRRPHRG